MKKPSSATYENKIVCFIDILGFSNIVAKTLNSQPSLQNIVDALSFIHSHFLALKSVELKSIQLSQFSDSVVISFPIKDESTMIVLFKNLKYVQVHLLSKYKMLMRGGVVIGEVIHNDLLLLGPAMINAYMLESKCAMSPRIVIDPKVRYRYNKVRKKKNESKTIVKKDLDDTSYIDYFNLDDIDSYLNETPQQYFLKICEIVRDNVNSKNISIRMKYLWIRNKLKKSTLYIKNDECKLIYKIIVTQGKTSLND